MKAYLPILATLLLLGCSNHETVVVNDVRAKVDSAKLAKVLASQDEDIQGRYPARHPQETLEFFGIAPGMTVVEALPGGGWYSKILMPYLGTSGKLVGVDYAQDMWPLFGFFSAEDIEAKKTWVADWTELANGWRNMGDAPVSAFTFGSMPDSMNGQADAVLFIRAMHNLSRFEQDGAHLTTALNDAMRVLKPGGTVGIVQHRVSSSTPADAATGSRGYLRQADVITFMEKAGFEYVGASEINANPKDRPGAEDIVWRLPPTLFTSREDEDLRKQMMSIGESDRMTLKFRKP